MNTIADLHAARAASMTVRNGKTVPLSIADPASAHQALRRHCVVVDYSHFAIVDVAGEEAFECLDAIVSGDLAAIRDGQALYTFVLDDAGEVVTDLYVLCDDERYILLTEGMSAADLIACLSPHLDEHAPTFSARDELASVLFEGPYSWEVAKELFGMDVIGLPFMEHMHVSGGMLFRAGNHGEFSYHLICDQATAHALLADQDGLYAKYDAVFAGLDFQNLARLENPCWDEARLGAFSRCPIELQAQWMVRYDKDQFIGKDALEHKLAQGAARRMVGFVADRADGVDAAGIERGHKVLLGGLEIGVVITAGVSPERGGLIGQALIKAEYAYADIAGFVVQTAAGDVAIATSAIPFVRNFSFLVNPLEHSYVDPSRHKNLLEQAEAAKAAAERAAQDAANADEDARTESV